MEASAPAMSTTEVKFRKVAGFGGSGNSPEGGGGDGADSSSSIPPAEGMDRNPSTRSGSGGEVMEYFGWVYHLGTNTIGHQYCHLRFLIVRGKRVYMFKRDPHQSPGIKPIRKGAVWPTLMVEEIGRRKVNNGDLYVIRFYNRLDEAKKGEIACGSAGEARTWMEAFDHAKQQAEFELARGVSFRNKLHVEPEINLEAHRPRVRRYAYDLKKFIRIGQGPETLLRRSSSLQSAVRSDGYFEGESGGDAIEAHQWRCVRTINGVRIFEDVSDSKGRKGTLVKAVAVVDATADTIFEVVLNVDQHQRNEWDNMTGNLELLDTYDGHCDVVYGTYDPKYLTRWQSSRDFVFSRQWFRGQEGTYTILQFPAIHKKRPPKSGYRRTKINPSTWEIRNLNAPMGSNSARSIVTQMLEIHEAGWYRWKKNSCSKFEKTIPYALLSQLAGLKEYIGANPALKVERPSMVVHAKVSDGFISSSDYEDAPDDEFYDATAAAEESSSSSSEESGDDKPDNQDGKVKLKNVSWAITSLALKQNAVLDANKELDSSVPAVSIDPSQFHAILRKAEDDNDSNCWTSPNGTGFKIRGKNYLKDYSKVMGEEPLLQLIGVDWFKVNTRADHVALHPRCLVQELREHLGLALSEIEKQLSCLTSYQVKTEAGKKLPFILLVNLQIPAKPNYSLVLYYASDRPVNESSLLGKFVNGTDMFRDSRFKLIPSIIEGYWMVKRAVGTKACLLGKAVTCKYFRQDNFLEIDVDIGSSSVARSVVGLVLGYVTSLVVDLAILVEAKEEEELPEYILGTVRLSRIKLESAVPLEV